jgi:cyclase
MHIDQIDTDILLFRGDCLESVATAFIDGERVLLIDALASEADAREMRAHLEGKLGKRVETIVLTHCFTDHMAGTRLFPDADIIAQRLFLYTFMEQRGRPRAEVDDFVAPSSVVDRQLTLTWGRHTLELFHNPGKTVCSLGIEVASADLLFVADNVVGNIAYIGASAPELIDEAIARLQRRGRRRIIPGHIGMHDWTALPNARHYLRRLREQVVRARAAHPGAAEAGAIRTIGIEDCIAAGVQPNRFEREWHGQNLERIVERRLFEREYRMPAPASAGTLWRGCCASVGATLATMFRQLALRGG